MDYPLVFQSACNMQVEQKLGGLTYLPSSKTDNSKNTDKANKNSSNCGDYSNNINIIFTFFVWI
jgi:hypothetical protein